MWEPEVDGENLFSIALHLIYLEAGSLTGTGSWVIQIV